MKFVLFTTNLAGGGAEKALAKIGDGLARRGHAVTFVVCEDQGQYPPPATCEFRALTRRTGHGWLSKRRLAWRLRRCLRHATHDLLISTLPFADEVAALARVPRHVCRIANTLSTEIAELPPGKGLRRTARYRNLYRSRPLVAVSQGVAEDMREQFAVTAGKVRVIGNPFDADAIRQLTKEPSAKLPEQPFILHVGRFAVQKRHDLLIGAFASLASKHILVLLAPPDDRLAALVAAHGVADRVVVAGFQGNPYPWMAAADLLVLCSDHEGLPNVLIEALICGTRVVSTDCPSGPREILAGELSQWLVPCGDAPALALMMRRALADPKPRRTVVDSVAVRYSADRALDRWEQLAAEQR